MRELSSVHWGSFSGTAGAWVFTASIVRREGLQRVRPCPSVRRSSASRLRSPGATRNDQKPQPSAVEPNAWTRLPILRSTLSTGEHRKWGRPSEMSTRTLRWLCHRRARSALERLGRHAQFAQAEYCSISGSAPTPPLIATRAPAPDATLHEITDPHMPTPLGQDLGIITGAPRAQATSASGAGQRDGATENRASKAFALALAPD